VGAITTCEKKKTKSGKRKTLIGVKTFGGWRWHPRSNSFVQVIKEKKDERFPQENPEVTLKQGHNGWLELGRETNQKSQKKA